MEEIEPLHIRVASIGILLNITKKAD